MQPPDLRTPGHLIQLLLDQRGWTQKVLALSVGCDVTTINKLISGKKALDAETALALGEVFSEKPERFLQLQKDYELAQAKLVAKPDPGRVTRAKLFGDLPVSDMAKRGWLRITDTRNLAQVESALEQFFKTSSTKEIVDLPHAARKTSPLTGVTLCQLAWLYRVQEMATEMLVQKYRDENSSALIEKLRPLLASEAEIRKIPRILSEFGIRYMIVEALPGSKMDGVCLWLNEHSPVIAMSLRFDRIDNFWFVLRHELEHVFKRHGGGDPIIDSDIQSITDREDTVISEEESAANDAAAEFTVPERFLKQFVARKAPFFAERDILGFARTIKVHPGIVAGRLQHMTNRYDRFRSHLVKVRSIIAPEAIVDGWGDVAPTGL